MLLDDTLRDWLRMARRIAIIGAKDTAGHPVDRVGRYMLEAGYDIVPVHPVRKHVWGLPAVACLADIDAAVDIINLFRAPEYCPAHAREALALPWRPRVFWMQSGIRYPEAGRMLSAAGVGVVADLCIMVEHKRLFGKY